MPRDLTTVRAAALRLPNQGGVELVAVYPGSPAVHAGLRPNDIITHMNDQPIQVSRQALNIIAALMPGDKLRLRGIRAGRPFAIEATVAERPVS